MGDVCCSRCFFEYVEQKDYDDRFETVEVIRMIARH